MSYSRKRGIPLARESASDPNSFTPIYESEAVRWARRFNLWLMAFLWVVYIALVFFLVLIPLNDTVASGGAERGFPQMFWAAIVGFALPSLLGLLGTILIPQLTARVAFDLRGVYEETTEDLKRWLPESLGPWPGNTPLKSEGGILGMVESTLNWTAADERFDLVARQLARGVQDEFLLSNLTGELVRLTPRAGGYELAIE